MRYGLVDQDIQPAAHLTEQLGDDWSVTVGVDGTEDALIAALEGVDVLFATSRLPITRRVLEATDLAVVAKIGTGIDNVDLDAASDRGIPVTYTPGFNALAVAEHTVALILAVKRRIGHSQDVLREGGWRDDLPLGSMLSRDTIGIIGFGNVGRRVGSLLSGFHPELLAYDPYVLEIDTEQPGATFADLADLLARSDVVSVNAELTEETRHMLDASSFRRMKDDAVVVNTARGEIIDQPALVNAIESGEIAGAGLDVFEDEPLAADSPLHDLDTVVTTPHAAGLAIESRTRTMEILARNTCSLLAGEAVPDHFMAARPG